MEQQLIQPNLIQFALSEAGWDMEKELLANSVATSQFELPRVRIRHQDNGKHEMYIDYGDSYLNEESKEVMIKDNKLTAIVFAEQFIRAYWTDGLDIPTCSAINDRVTVDKPLSESCKTCEHSDYGGDCKPKIRLLLLAEIQGEIQPLIFNLSPTSIKHWIAHKKKLQRSGLPVVAVNTTFELQDIKKTKYRWAETKISMDGIASKEMLVKAKSAREQFERLTKQISDADFSDKGDKLPF